MFEKLKKMLGIKDHPESKEFRWKMARQICGHHVKYVTERINDVEEVIG